MSNVLKKPNVVKSKKKELNRSLPKKYKVLLLNDNVTPMDFVVNILIDVFYYELQNAINKMLQVHNEGKAICGIYSYDIATTLQHKVIFASKVSNYPLKCIVEEYK